MFTDTGPFIEELLFEFGPLIIVEGGNCTTATEGPRTDVGH
jgi:hypothetical protein